MSQNDRFIKIAKIDDNFFGVKIQKKSLLRQHALENLDWKNQRLLEGFFSNALCLLGVIYVRASSHKRPS